MVRSPRPRLAFAASALLLLAATSVAAQPDQIAAGRRIAQHYCGACHAVAAGRSRLHDAPPFRALYQRYRRGDLDALLAEGQLPPDRQDEEGDTIRHPRMPNVPLGADEVTSLKAYLLSLDPRERRRR